MTFFVFKQASLTSWEEVDVKEISSIQLRGCLPSLIYLVLLIYTWYLLNLLGSSLLTLCCWCEPDVEFLSKNML